MCAGQGKAKDFLTGIYDQAGSNRGPYHQQWVGSFPLLEYKMVWTRCRFDTPGNLISPDCPQRTKGMSSALPSCSSNRL